MNVEVIIVSFNSMPVLPRCLDALQRQSLPHTVQVIDNASMDNTPIEIHRRYPDIAVLPLRRNTGFARAVNIAAQRSTADVIITLNPDTVPDEDFVRQISGPLAAPSAIAGVAGTMVFESRPDIIASAGINVHRNGVAIDNLLGECREAGHGIVPVFGASGGAAAFRRSAFLEAGGFPESFFMYLEDVDLAWRLRLTGHEAIWNPAALVQHRYSASAGEGSTFKQRLIARNRLWTLVRCLPACICKRDWPRILAFDAAATGYGVATLNKAIISGRASALAGLLPRLVERDRIQRMTTVDIEDLERWIQPPISPTRMRALRKRTAALAHVSV